jgi:ubiquinone/menaquinone biosynthesis C-methylase UbiE
MTSERISSPGIPNQQDVIQRLYDKFSPDYDAYNQRTPIRQSRRIVQEVMKSLSGQEFRPSSLLDLGAGTGATIEAIKEQVFGKRIGRVVAVDLSRGMLKQLTAKGIGPNLLMVRGSIESYLKTSSETFDLITAVSVFDFVPELPKVASEAASHLGKAGVLAMTYIPRFKEQLGSDVFESVSLGESYTEYAYYRDEIESSLVSRGHEVLLHTPIQGAYERGNVDINYNLIVVQNNQ